MRAKSMVLILIALGCGLVASIAISQVMERGSKSANAGLETVQIYVATADIDVNDAAVGVRTYGWKTGRSPRFPRERSKTSRKSTSDSHACGFTPGEPILTPKLVNEIEGPAIKIPDGHRVCSLKVQMDTAVSGLVNPGDRVDIFGYFKEGRGIPKTGTREILKNVRVFAVNDQTDQETDQEGRTIVAKTVSVLVKQDQVAKLMLATELGTLRLALRRPNEESLDESAARTPRSNLSLARVPKRPTTRSKAAPGQPVGLGRRWFREFPEQFEEPEPEQCRGTGAGARRGRATAPRSGLANDGLDSGWRHAVHLER